ncbi:MAG: hypothetical protein ACQETE_11390 [Bacteroidota bacterium]
MNRGIIRTLFLLISAVLLNVSGLPSNVSAQSNKYLGINLTQSTNFGDLGVTPEFEILLPQNDRLSYNIIIGGFIGLFTESSTGEDRFEYHHYTLNTDVGITYELTNKKMAWYIGAGPSIRIGSHHNVVASSWRGDQLIDYKLRKAEFAWIGFYIKTGIAFNNNIRLNINFQHYPASSPYLSIGPSINFW